MQVLRSIVLILTLTCWSAAAFAQYNAAAGSSAPMEEREIQWVDDLGHSHTRVERTAPKRDGFGNAAGSTYDLAVDGAFEGQTVAVIQLYDFPFDQARAALKEKGFGVYRWNHQPPSPQELREKLAKACQLWIISGDRGQLTDAHIEVIRDFYASGKGLYVWGDNTPYHADADAVTKALFGARMSGGYMGSKVVHMKVEQASTGLLPDHLLTTGLEHIFEGITIAALRLNGGLQPLIWSSDGNVVTAFYDRDGRRAIVDGGFTRLYNSWDTAGTGRYVKNAAAWLVNYERFGDAVVATKK